MELEIRPYRGRLRTPVVTLIVITVVCGGCTSFGAFGNSYPVDGTRVVFCYLLAVLPLLAFGPQVLASGFNYRLWRRADGALESRDWLGRTVRLPYPDSVQLYDVGQSQLIVISDSRVDRAIVLNPGWYIEEDLAPFLDAIGRPAEAADAGLVDIARWHPGGRLPFSLAHPAVFAVTLIGGSMAWVIGSVVLGLHLAPGHPL